MNFSDAKSFFNHKYTLGLLLCFIYGYLAYFTSRSQFILLIILVGCAAFFSFLLFNKSSLTFKQLLGLSIIFRLVFIFSIPQLSQDFFRFFWDGQLVINSINPYLQTVDDVFNSNSENLIHQAQTLREGMGSLNAENYSNYPPFSQFIYACSAWLSQGSVLGFIVVIRLFLIIFDLLFIYFSKKLLDHLNISPLVLFLYVLNPLCILEISANLHLEGVMISLFLGSIYSLLKRKYLLCGVLLSLSVGTKLLSIIALPLILIFIWKKNTSATKYKFIAQFSIGFIAVLILQVLPFFSLSFINNFSESIGLWFGKFEFNASIYYLVRWFGFQIYGYNIIGTYGLIMPVITSIIFIFIIFSTKPCIGSLLKNFLWMLSIYFLLSTTVHPWYILFPLAISLFCKYRYPVVWALAVFLSYHAYTESIFKENTSLITLQYVLIFVAIIYEIWTGKSIFMRTKKTVAQVGAEQN